MKVDKNYTNDSLHVVSYFEDTLRGKHHENVKNFFEREIQKKSKINIGENKDTIEKLHASEENAKKIKEKMNSLSIFRGLSIAGLILFVLGGIVLLVAQSEITELDFWLKITLGVLSIVIGLSAIIPIVQLSRRLKEEAVVLKKYNDEIDNYTAESWKQTECVNELFDAKHTFRLIEQTMPTFKINDFLDSKSFYPWLKYTSTDDDESIIDVRSGSIRNNPFIVLKRKRCQITSQAYSGSITVSWQVTTGSGENKQTYTHTEVVSATIYKPMPIYTIGMHATFLHDVAEELNFSGGKSARLLIDKKKDKHKQFAMENDEFNDLFPTVRNSEQHYRVLFTPLAQEEMVKLLKHRNDYAFAKDGKLNIVHSNSFNQISMNADPSCYFHNDFEVIKNTFINFNIDYLYNLYFSLAPILTIPLYQQMEGKKTKAPASQKGKFSYFEHESVANNMHGEKKFAHIDCATDSILKTKLIESGDTHDLVEVTAYGYRAVPRIEYVHKSDSRGVPHTIPVHWTEYIAVQNKGIFIVQESPKALSQKQFNRVGDTNKKIADLIETPYKIGSLLSYVPKKSFTKKHTQEIIELLLAEEKNEAEKKTPIAKTPIKKNVAKKRKPKPKDK